MLTFIQMRLKYIEQIHSLLLMGNEILPVYLNIIPQICTESADMKVHAFQTSILEGEWSVSCLGCFNPSKRALNHHWIRNWVDPKIDADVVRRENFLPLIQFKSSSSSSWLITCYDLFVLNFTRFYWQGSHYDNNYFVN
jgi:hypothetical protein